MCFIEKHEKNSGGSLQGKIAWEPKQTCCVLWEFVYIEHDDGIILDWMNHEN